MWQENHSAKHFQVKGDANIYFIFYLEANDKERRAQLPLYSTGNEYVGRNWEDEINSFVNSAINPRHKGREGGK